MVPDDLAASLVASYRRDGGINHLDGRSLPAQRSINVLADAFMRLLFPGFFEVECLTEDRLEAWTHARLAELRGALGREVACCQGLFPHPGAPPAAELATAWLTQLPALRSLLQTDVQAAYAGDPAARSVEEILLAYPFLPAIALQRVAHAGYQLGVPLLPRMLTEYAHRQTGIDIHPGAAIDSHFFIDHGTGVVVGETCRIGHHVKLYQGVTLGARSFPRDASGALVKGLKRHPDIEDHVTIYAGATILGGDTRIGAHSIIGANVWLMESVPAHTVVVDPTSRPSIRLRDPANGEAAAGVSPGGAPTGPAGP